MNQLLTRFLILIIALGAACQMHAQIWNEIAKFNSPDTTPNNRFGHSLDISGVYAVVGSPFIGANPNVQGKAYIYKWDGTNWNLDQTLMASDGRPNDLFGSSVGIEGNTLVVGASNGMSIGDSSGAAYVFEMQGNSWVQQQILVDSLNHSFKMSSEFGSAVDVHQNMIAVGDYMSPHNSSTTPNSGAVFLFERNQNTWTQKQMITAADANLSNNFGASVTLSDSNLLIGESTSNEVIAFEKTNGVFSKTERVVKEASIVGPDVGDHISVYDNLAIVSARSDNSDTTLYGGLVYQKNAGSWQQTAKLRCPPRTGGEVVVACSTKTAVVGMSGKIEMFESSNGSFNRTNQMVPSDRNSLPVNDLALHLGWVIAGNSVDGVVYIFNTFPPSTSTEDLGEPSNSTLRVYPNPSTGTVYIESPNSPISTVKVYASNGILLTTYLSHEWSGQLDLPEDKGLYLIEVSNGNQTDWKKVIRR
ncbi:T9SS type A sorting domain-containing protein [bacterium SCSIO 12741]|nr:T9SS type A sorting domain-containing protein [bacterium SCSIO 12741]